MIVKFIRMHILFNLLYSEELWNSFMCISVSEGPHSFLERVVLKCKTPLGDVIGVISHSFRLQAYLFNSPSMTSDFQQGKPMPCSFGKGEETGNSLHTNSPIEQPPGSVERCMRCQKLYFKCLIKLVKGAAKN